ncbi:hypothetical protein QT20_00240, partial [Staphylococcus aureus]
DAFADRRRHPRSRARRAGAGRARAAYPEPRHGWRHPEGTDRAARRGEHPCRAAARPDADLAACLQRRGRRRPLRRRVGESAAWLERFRAKWIPVRVKKTRQN